MGGFVQITKKKATLSLSYRHLENISLNISLANKCNDIICCTHILGRQNIEKFKDISNILYIAIFLIYLAFCTRVNCTTLSSASPLLN